MSLSITKTSLLSSFHSLLDIFIGSGFPVLGNDSVGVVIQVVPGFNKTIDVVVSVGVDPGDVKVLAGPVRISVDFVVKGDIPWGVVVELISEDLSVPVFTFFPPGLNTLVSSDVNNPGFNVIANLVPLVVGVDPVIVEVEETFDVSLKATGQACGDSEG